MRTRGVDPACSGLIIKTLMQANCQDFLSTSLMQVVSTYISILQHISNCIKSDFGTDLTQLDEANKLDAI